jgi:hypothetical protein
VNLHATQVVPLPNYRLFLLLNNGVSGDVGFSKELDSEIFGALRDPELFAAANQHPVMGSAAWANGIDLGPEFLCDLVRAQHQQLAS